MTAIATARRADLIGSAYMVCAMALFAVEDAFIKAAATTLPLGQILIIFGVGGAVVFALRAQRMGQPLFVPDVLSRPMRIRVLFEITGRLFYGLAIALIPLSAATVILQATPLVVVAGAALLFGETVGWRRWTAIIIGLIGVVIIIRPGTDGFSALSLLAVIGMAGFAGRDLASRAAPLTVSTTLLGFYGFCALVIAGVLYTVWDGFALRAVTATTALWLAGTIAAGVIAYTCLMRAMRTGDVSAVTPFRYSRLLFGIALGVALFGERPDAATWIGSGLIVLAGLFIMWRGKNADT
ncbi:EamA-like transporter family protein [Loktanella sp. DSM 29012]|uniref:DMT family transporter n=1 Tax=Loktanella sp. DSM 29012 TaxID=1881056 RepID=UPI0008CE1839|nr:DMT family transporter [Loktanella sp. DSM 29012]SEQ05639.1 EamA-like transporter family protein [Loktanella sp. DSM 29012]